MTKLYRYLPCSVLVYSLVASSFAMAGVSTEALQNKAAIALRVDKSAVKITDIDDRSEQYTTHFTARTGNNKFACYVQAGGGMVSDAICSSGGKKTCDALSAAAGKC